MEKQVVDVNGVMEMFGIGKNKAYELGEKSGAKFRLGRSVRYDVKKLNEYREKLVSDINQEREKREDR